MDLHFSFMADRRLKVINKHLTLNFEPYQGGVDYLVLKVYFYFSPQTPRHGATIPVKIKILLIRNIQILQQNEQDKLTYLRKINNCICS